MQLHRSVASASLLEGSVKIHTATIPRRLVFFVALAMLLVAGFLSPLFDLNHIHGFPGAKAYGQHLYFDGISDAGGFYASTFCKHWYHRIPIAIIFALVSTYTLVSLVG